MVKKKTFLLVSLEEEKAKKLAQVISNDTCRRILDYLAEKKATETELAKNLDMPISTVHYNLKHLLDNKLVEAEEFHYSEKGREVLHYSLANQYVIIAPKGVSESFKEKLRSLLPVALIVGAAAFALQFSSRIFGGVSKVAGAREMAKASYIAEEALAEPALMAASPTADSLAGAASCPVCTEHSIVLWFLIGAVTAIAVYLLAEYLRKKMKKK